MEDLPTVLIADDDPDFRDLLARLIERDGGLRLVGSVDGVCAGIEACERLRPTVAAIDVRMPHGGGVAVARAIARSSPSTRVLALSNADDRASVLAMLAAGATGYVLKGAGSDALIRALHDAAEGGTPVAGSVATTMLSELGDRLRAEEVDESDVAERRARLQQIIDERTLVMHLQPIVDLGSGQVVGAEALARFPGDRGPQPWFEDAAACGLSSALELMAIELAIAELPKLPAGAFISVNASPPVLDDVAAFLETLDRSVATRIVVEVTEGAPMGSDDDVLPVLETLRSLGVRVAIDDLGAGYTSLRDTLRLDPDLLKLDRSLTTGLDYDHDRRALTSAFIAFAQQTGAAVVAEGIETRAELHALRTAGVPYGQGYLLGRPRIAAAGEFEHGVTLPEPGAGVMLRVIGDEDRPVLIGAPDRSPGATAAAGVHWESAGEAVETILSRLEAVIPESVIWVSHLDYADRSWRALDIRRGEAHGVRAGSTIALDRAACFHVAATRAPRPKWISAIRSNSHADATAASAPTTRGPSSPASGGKSTL